MTYEMVGVADQNGRTYESIYGTYNKKRGFILNNSALSLSKTELLHKITHENCWSLKQEKLKPRKMTIQEINKALGYDVEIIDKDDKQTDENNTYCNNSSFNDLLKFLHILDM